MIMQVVNELGPWNWWILGGLLLALEIMAPGTFFLWFGLAAMAVGTVSLSIGTGSNIWTWEVQLIAFMGLSLIFAIVGRRVMTRYGWDESEEPDLNDRGSQMVGRMAVVSSAIEEGRGRVTLGDTTWSVEGPDMPVGTRVRILGNRSSILMVEKEG